MTPTSARGTGKSVAHIKKEALKFASAHMTVFPDGTKEALHGHNYRTEVSIGLKSIALAEMVPFSIVKSAMKTICDEWDEKVLIARDCPFYRLNAADSVATEFVLCGKRYVLPTDEIAFIPRDNVTTETLSAEFCERLLSLLEPAVLARVSSISIRIEEILGQGASYHWTATP